MSPYDHIASLVLFARIVRFGSLSATAEHMGVNRSSVSKQLAALEDKIGARLIQRTTRKLSLTEIGEQILLEAYKVEEVLESVENISNRFQHQVRGQLKISCASALGRKYLVPILSEFTQHFPSVDINLQLEDRFVDLVEENIDVGIRVGHLPDSSLVARRLGDLTWQLSASPNYLKNAPPIETPQDLLQHDCMHYRNSTSSLHKWDFIGPQGPESVAVKGRLAMNDAAALVDAAIAGMGVLLIDRAMLGDAIAKGQLVSLLDKYDPMPGFPVYAIYPAREFLPAKTQAFVDFLLEVFSPRLQMFNA